MTCEIKELLWRDEDGPNNVKSRIGYIRSEDYKESEGSKEDEDYKESEGYQKEYFKISIHGSTQSTGWKVVFSDLKKEISNIQLFKSNVDGVVYNTDNAIQYYENKANELFSARIREIELEKEASCKTHRADTP